MKQAIICMLVICGLAGGCSDDDGNPSGPGDGGPTLRQLTSDGGYEPSYSPDGTKIAYTRSVETPTPGVFVQIVCTIPEGGGNPAQLVTNAEDPAWSPDGSRIAYSSHVSPARLFQIYTVPAGGGSPTQITTNPAYNHFDASWSPDGTEIAFWSAGSGNDDIWVVNVGTGVERRLTTDPAEDWRPAWSQEGSQIAFVSSRSGTNRIWVVPADGGTPIQLSVQSMEFDGGHDNPAWKPDGSVIAFTLDYDPGGADIFVMPLTGGNATRLIQGCYDPAWSPDGNKIAFTRSEQIWIASFE